MAKNRDERLEQQGLETKGERLVVFGSLPLSPILYLLSPILYLLSPILYLLSTTPCPLSAMQGGEYFMESSVIASGGGNYVSGGDYLSKGAISQSFFPANTDISRGGNFVNRLGFYNPPHFTFQKGKTAEVIFPSGNISLFLPSNAVDKDVYDITLNKNPTNAPILADSSKIENANKKIEHNEGQWSKLFSNNLTEIVIFDEESYFNKPFVVPSLLTMNYTDADNNGILDSSLPPVRVETIRPWILAESLDTWVRLADSTLNQISKTITASLYLPGVIALIGLAYTDVSDVKVYPVPFRPYGPNAGSEKGQTGTESDGIFFESIPQRGNIEIYSVDGVLVKKIKIPENLPTQIYKWNVRNDAGSRVASGVYIWRVVSGSNSKTGKLMIIW